MRFTIAVLESSGTFFPYLFLLRGIFLGVQCLQFIGNKNPRKKRSQGLLKFFICCIGLNSDFCLLAFSWKNWRLQFGLFNVKIKYIINSLCFWLELCQLYKLMFQISCYSSALKESSTLDSATRDPMGRHLHVV